MTCVGRWVFTGASKLHLNADLEGFKGLGLISDVMRKLRRVKSSPTIKVSKGAVSGMFEDFPGNVVFPSLHSPQFCHTFPSRFSSPHKSGTRSRSLRIFETMPHFVFIAESLWQLLWVPVKKCCFFIFYLPVSVTLTSSE